MGLMALTRDEARRMPHEERKGRFGSMFVYRKDAVETALAEMGGFEGWRNRVATRKSVAVRSEYGKARKRGRL